MLDLVRPFLPLIPEVSAPDRKVRASTGWPYTRSH